MSSTDEPARLDAAGSYQPYALLDLTRPAGSRPVPPAFNEAAVLDARARRAYSNARYTQAADLFMTVAGVLRAAPDQFYAEALAAGRLVAYQNAAAAWAMADALELARPALRAAAAADPECADALGRLLENPPSSIPRLAGER